MRVEARRQPRVRPAGLGRQREVTRRHRPDPSASGCGGGREASVHSTSRRRDAAAWPPPTVFIQPKVCPRASAPLTDRVPGMPGACGVDGVPASSVLRHMRRPQPPQLSSNAGWSCPSSARQRALPPGAPPASSTRRHAQHSRRAGVARVARPVRERFSSSTCAGTRARVVRRLSYPGARRDRSSTARVVRRRSRRKSARRIALAGVRRRHRPRAENFVARPRLQRRPST